MKQCSSYTIPQLKQLLKKRGLKVSGTKPVLCDRLEEDRRSRRKTKKHPASIPIKVVDISNSSFKFYSSLYYQMPGSKMALQELEKYGFSKSYLDRFTTFQNLWSSLKEP